MTTHNEPGLCPAGTPTLLALPCNIFDELTPLQKQQITAIQIGYARDSSALQSAAYNQILAIVERPQQTGPTYG
jgi:hypothetical protein